MNEWTHKHQLEIKEHINELARKREDKAEELYNDKKRKFVNQYLEKKKREITKALATSIKKFENTIKEIEIKAQKISYDLEYDFEYKIPKIKEDKIESALEKDFDRKNEEKLKEAKEIIEQKRLQAVEKILFCDAKEQQQIIKELREMKIEL